MKKKQLQPNNRLYRNAGIRITNPNQFRLRHLNDVSLRSRQKSLNSSIKKPSVLDGLSQTDTKIQIQKSNKYRAYLESEAIAKVKVNRRYSRRQDKQPDDSRPGAVSSRHERNQSMDLFKIRKSKVTASQKVSASSFSRLDDTIVDFEVAKGLYKQGKFTEALQIAQACLQRDNSGPDTQYYTAMINLNLQNYGRGLELLSRICKEYPQYKKTSFMFAAIAAKHVEDYEKALRFCNWGLERFPNYANLLEYRASLHMTQGEFQQAHEDYELLIKSDPNNIQLHLKNAQCLTKVEAYAHCLSSLASALSLDKGQHRAEILTRRIEIHLNKKTFNVKEARKDLNKLMQCDPNNLEGFYFKGLVLEHEGYGKESILSFEQCLREGCPKQLMGKSLVEIVKSKINDRDFYSANYHVNRSQYFDLGGQQLQVYRLFCEGVVHLMKRKVAEGDRNFTVLLQKHPQLTPELQKIFHLYRAFSKFCLSDYESAIESYELANKQRPLDMFAKYNRQLAQAIVEINRKNYDRGLEFLNAAEKIVSPSGLNKIDPYLYRGAAHIQKAKDLMKSPNELEQLKSLEEIFAGLKQFDRAYDINEGNSNMLFYRSLIYLYLGKHEEALQDIIKAISKSEENVAKYFFFRALAHNSLGNRKQALNDFNICSNLDDKFAHLYLERAKVHFANENVTKGLEDLAKLKNLNPSEDIKFHEACLNYYHGHYIMANSCCDDIADPEKARAIRVLVKTKLGKVKQARKHIRARADQMIYEIILGSTDVEQAASQKTEFFQQYHYHHYLGVKHFREGNYSKALECFVMANKERSLYDLEIGVASNSLHQPQEDEEAEDDDRAKDAANRINYNIFLCHLQLREWKKGYEVFIRDVVGAKDEFLKNQFIASFSHLLFQTVKEPSSQAPEQDKEMYELSLHDSKLDRVLPEVLVQVPNFVLKTRLCLLGMVNPKLEKLYKSKINTDFILDFMSMSEIENRPEPPWVKRVESGLIFTNEVQNINIEFQTTENDEESQDGEDQEGEEDQAEEDVDQPENEDSEANTAKGGNSISVRKFKEKMKLDDSIERKLQKIMDMSRKN